MNRTVLVTGSSRGIGFGIAQEFAAHGDKVVLNGRIDQVQLDKAVEELNRRNQGNCNVMGILADMSNYIEAEMAFNKIKSHFGSVDILVNNAGLAHFGLFTDMKPHEWDDVIRHNFIHILNATHLAVPDMVRAKKGVIINISSIWGTTGASCEAVYSAAKGATHAFTRSMAQELGPSGVRVCAIACGAIETRMNSRLSQEEQEAFTERIPLMRFGNAEEVGKLVYFLASSEASYLTGQVIGLDGGLN
ncbi:MAG: glucose 1-dehydrogenase [Defluviitaleaceae bacterium]|nr:glucose 1-dehydrogenase [Defluviitaleaceae bacterium]